MIAAEGAPTTRKQRGRQAIAFVGVLVVSGVLADFPAEAKSYQYYTGREVAAVWHNSVNAKMHSVSAEASTGAGSMFPASVEVGIDGRTVARGRNWVVASVPYGYHRARCRAPEAATSVTDLRCYYNDYLPY